MDFTQDMNHSLLGTVPVCLTHLPNTDFVTHYTTSPDFVFSMTFMYQMPSMYSQIQKQEEKKGFWKYFQKRSKCC